MTATAGPWKCPLEAARYRRPYDGRCTTEIAAVASRAAGSASGRATISVTGRKEARRRSRISSCSVAGTIAPCTRKAIRSSDCPTASSSSAGRTAVCSYTCRRSRECPNSRRGSTRSERRARARPGRADRNARVARGAAERGLRDRRAPSAGDRHACSGSRAGSQQRDTARPGAVQRPVARLGDRLGRPISVTD